MPQLAVFLCLLFATNTAVAAEHAPSLDYLEITSFVSEEEYENDAAVPHREGEGAALRFAWQASEHIVFKGGYRETISSTEATAALERSDRLYDVAMAFVAPFSDSTRLLVELGLAGEIQELTTASGQVQKLESSPDVFAALDFRLRFNAFEIGWRSAGQTFHGERHQEHFANLRYHLSDHLAIGANVAVSDRDEQEARRAGLNLQWKF